MSHAAFETVPGKSDRALASSSRCAAWHEIGCFVAMTGVLLITSFVLLAGAVSISNAAEKRCADLGANCICSEPLGAAAYPGSGPYYNPSDSTTKQCAVDSSGSAIVRPAGDLIGGNNSTILSRLPSGHQVSYYMRAGDRHLGTFYFGHGLGAAYTTRTATRWYEYWTDGNGDGEAFLRWQNGCRSNKTFFLSNGIVTLGGGPFDLMMYNFLGWSPPSDCCWLGPTSSGDRGPTSDAAWNGRWWRMEFVQTYRHASTNPGQQYRLQFFIKDITNNQPERLVIDTFGSEGFGPAAFVPRSNPPVHQDINVVQPYRDNQANPSGYCSGYGAFRNLLVAGWDTDAGQRIGPAYEIEGGGSLPSTPSPAINLKIQ